MTACLVLAGTLGAGTLLVSDYAADQVQAIATAHLPTAP